MKGMLTIGQLAKQAGVPISTVRYYEGRGLLEAEGRSAAKYRLYGPAGLHRLRFIRAAQESGFTLEDASKLLKLRDGEVNPCGEVQDLVRARLLAIETELKRMKRVRKVLSETLVWCQKPRSKGSCEAVAHLDELAKTPRRRKR